MNNLTTSPVAQYCMQIKDKASTSVKVVSTIDDNNIVRTISSMLVLRTIEHDRIRCLSHRDELNRLTLDLDSRRKWHISITEMNSTAQYKLVLARVYIALCMHECYIYIASVRAIYRLGLSKPRECEVQPAMLVRK